MRRLKKNLPVTNLCLRFVSGPLICIHEQGVTVIFLLGVACSCREVSRLRTALTPYCTHIALTLLGDHPVPVSFACRPGANACKDRLPGPHPIRQDAAGATRSAPGPGSDPRARLRLSRPLAAAVCCLSSLSRPSFRTSPSMAVGEADCMVNRKRTQDAYSLCKCGNNDSPGPRRTRNAKASPSSSPLCDELCPCDEPLRRDQDFMPYVLYILMLQSYA